MQFKWIIWTVFCNSVSGAIIQRIHGHEKNNATKNAISSSSDDYDTNYPDYEDRDYPNLDYYDDSRGGRSFNHNHDDPSEDSRNFDEQDAEDFMLKQLKSTIPGTPGVDYALYQSVPETSFRCETQPSPGFYGDVEAQCQVFHICQEDDRQDSFLCPLGTVFNQISLICDWWFNFNCEDTPTLYYLNNKYDTSTGSTFMKDTVKRMNKLQNNDMYQMMGLDKVNMKIHNIKNRMRNTDSIKLSKSPIKNLFMLGMRNKKFEKIRNVITTKREAAENVVTAFPVIRTPLALQAMSSTGNFDIVLSENTTKTSLDGFHEQSTPKTIDIATENINVSDAPPTTLSAVLNSSFNSSNLSRIEVLTNGSAPAELKLDHSNISHNETNTTPGSLSTIMDTHSAIKTKNISLPEMKPGKIDTKDDKFEDDFGSYLQNEYPSKLNTEVLTNEGIVNDNSKSNVIIEKQQTPTILPLSKPFSQENRFIIGNDTHISVSVTIHSKSGNSKLQWKRLPGFKRIRKIQFKDEKETSTLEKHSANDAMYRKKSNEQKSRSRIMWIPAKRNILDRRLDWNSLFELRAAKAAGNSKNETGHMQTLNDFKKSALQSTEIPQIIFKDDSSDPETHLMNKSMEFELSEESNIDQAKKYTENNFSLATTEEKFQEYNETSNFPNSDLENLAKTQTNLKNNSHMHSETEKNCKTICIKLLKSLNKTSMREFGNNTDFENLPSSMFLTSESSYAQSQDDYQHKSILEFSPSEQWTLKYDSGPNCNENTEDDKILVKGWSVIIDIGSITKEKTVKRRSCTSSSDDKRFVLKNFNFVRNSQDENAAFDPKTSHLVMNSNSRLGSADQRYWINLVRNWLSQPQSNKNQGINSMKRDKEQNIYSSGKQMYEENADSKNSNYQDQARISSEYLHQKILPKRYRTNFYQNFDLNSEAESKKMHMEDTLIPEYNRMRPQNVQGSPKTISFPDLQTERSDWLQATQRRKDRSESLSNKRDSNDYNTPDVISDEIDQDVILDETGEDEDRLAEDARKRSNNFENSQTNRNSWMSEYQNPNRNSNMHNQWTDGANRNADQDYDDWSSQRRLSKSNWMGIPRHEEPHSDNPKSEEWGWSEKEQQNKKNSMAAPDRNTWNSELNNHWLNDKTNTGMSNTNKGLQPSFVGRTGDWPGRNKNKQSSDRDNQPSVSWQQDFDRKLPDGQHKARSPNSMIDVKGKSVPDVWSMIKKELKTYFMNKNPKGGWSLMKPSDTSWSDDKMVSRRNDRKSDSEQNKSSLPPSSTKDKHSQTSKNDKAFWSKDEENNWGTDSEPKWIMENQKGDKEWRKPAVRDADDTMRSRNDWYTEESAWNWDDQSSNKPQSKEWNMKSTSNKKKGISPGIDIKSDNIPDWSSMTKIDQNKGYATKGKELPTRPSQKHPGWTDEEEDDVWPAKSPRSDSWSSDHALNRMNFKGNSNLNKARAPSTSTKSGSPSDRNKWNDDEEPQITINRPHQKQDKGISSKPRMKYPQLKSEFMDSGEWLEGNEKRTRSRIPNNSKGTDFPQRTSRSDNGGSARSKMTDWENGSWNDRITLTKDIKVEDRNPYQSQGGRYNQRNEKTDTASWPMNGQTDSILSGYGRASQKPNLNNYWGSSKDIKGSRAPESASPNVNDQSKSEKPRKNSARSESDSDIKSIMWSAQISDDGKLANGWTPITLRPDLKNRVNGSQTGGSNKRTSLKNSDWNDDKGDPSKGRSADDKSKWNSDKIWDDKDQGMRNFPKVGNWRNERKGHKDKGSSSREERNRNKSDWGSEDSFFSDESRNFKGRRMTNRNSGISKNNQNMRIANHAEVIDIDPLTIHAPEASFNRLIYIPPKSTRNKRSYKHKDRQKKIIDRVDRSYIIIKNGKILNDTSKNIDKPFISQADTTVRDDKVDKTNNANSNIQKLSLQNTIKVKQNSSTLEINQDRFLKRSDAIYETNLKHDTTTIESVIREIWSSPFISRNFSASGWIPVTTFKRLNSKNVSYLNKSDNIKNVTHFQDKADESSLNTSSSILVANNFTADGASKHLSAITKDSDTKNKEIRENKNRTSTEKSENAKEMKVGNETLRILSFSDVMKQLQNQDKPHVDYKEDDKLWNKPITINPKTYSLKLNNPSKETPTNYSSSWILSSNENNTKKPRMLIRNGDNLDTNVKDDNDDQNPYKENIGVSTISAGMIDQLSNSTLSLSANKTHSSNIPRFQFTSWNANSNWTPIIRTVGRVVSYNRTLLSR